MVATTEFANIFKHTFGNGRSGLGCGSGDNGDQGCVALLFKFQG